MTTISPAGAHRPPTLLTTAASLRPLKRQTSATAIIKVGDKPLGQPADEETGSKRQKLDSPSSATASLDPPFNNSSSAIPNPRKLARAQDPKRLPLELVNGFFIGSEGIQESQPQSPTASRSTPPSLPHRPWKHSWLARAVTEGTLNNSGVKRKTHLKVQSVPYKSESPRDAPRFRTGRTADFAPWMGNHPEDVLNEQTVKHGFIDRIPVSQNETNTARQSLYGLFKHKSGLETLSALFASVLEERQSHSKISSSTSFKPPPRVTLTEAKRKAWLSDLANPVVPLRKLSRTIPQGIRGQALLDQCFAYNVPMGRALWFAKCVGANEIRTLKRKGTSAAFAAGAEVKWLRDWTANIEQFLESNIGQCRQADWRQRTNYSLSLAVRLCSESLLDRDHYLDWIVKSLSSASLDRLPPWLLLVHLHKTDLIKYRRRGILLAPALLQKLCTGMGHSQSPLAPLLARLKGLVSFIMHTNSACLVMPGSWGKFKHSIEKCLDLNTRPGLRILQQLSYRNERLSTPSGLDLLESRTVRQLVIDHLDSARSPFNSRKLVQDCRSTCEDMDVLVKVVLEWSSSRFRAGNYRVYLAVRLLEIFNDKEDVNPAVIDFLASQQTDTSCDHQCLRLLISELVRSQVFSLSRYLQWLTARGGLARNSLRNYQSPSSTSTDDHNDKREDSSGFNSAQVLTAVPLSILSPAVRNLRNILLARAGFSVDHETSRVKSYKTYIASQLPRLFKDETDSVVDAFAPDLSELDWSVRSEVALFLIKHVESFKASRKGSNFKDRGQASPLSILTDAEFRVIRSMCEDLGDLTVLIHVVKLCSTSDDEMLLASVTDTVNFHLDNFSALEALADLHSGLFRAYLSMRSSNGLPRPFIVSLMSLGSIVPSNLVSVSSLQQDLARGDRSLAVAACSPVSDGMADSLQQAGPAFTEEFEAVLSTGNRMEEQTMTQLFNVSAERLEKGQYQTQAENDEILCALHARLRIYRIAQFDILFAGWLQRLITTAKSRIDHLLPIFISTGCVSFASCVDTFLRLLRTEEDSTGEGSLIRTHLASFLEKVRIAEKGIDPISYKLKLENAQHIKQSPDCALELRIRSEASTDGHHAPLPKDLLIHLVHKEQAQNKVPPLVLTAPIMPLLDKLLQSVGDSSEFAIPRLVKSTTDLSMPFCRLRLQMWAAKPSLSSLTAGQEDFIETLFGLAKSDTDNAWVCYTKALGLEVTCRIREKAEEAFFTLLTLPNPGRNLPMALPAASCIDQATKFWRIVCRTAYSIPPAGVQAVATTLIERFAGVLRGLMAGKTAASNIGSMKQVNGHSASPGEETTGGNLEHLSSYLTLLLQMTSIHRNAFVASHAEPLSSPTALQKQGQQDVVKILVLLINIALHPALEKESGIVGHMFDVAATIVDDASDETKVLCARVLKDKMRDQRAEYLLGGANNSKETVSVHDGTQLGMTTEGLQVIKDGRRVGEYRSRTWEMLEGGVEASISLSLFDARKEVR